MKTRKLTVAQATIEFLIHQFAVRDGKESKFFAGCFGIFGHGNVAGLGQALQQYPEFRYYLPRNEQAMVHTAVGYAKMKNRLSTFACTSSIGPGATNMITGAAVATANRLPVLLLPGDIFATRTVAPVLQQIESGWSQDFSANDCFKPVSRYWDRINRPEQLITALPEALRVLTSPAQTGAVTLAMPQDVQAAAYEFPLDLFEKRLWPIARPRPDYSLLQKAATWIRDCKRPVIIAGGGVIYSEATDTLREFIHRTGIPVAETFAGKGSLQYDTPGNLGSVGVTGTPGGVQMPKEADLIIGIGTRYTDFTTSSKSLFQHPGVRFININIAEMDVHKHSALPLVGDARVILEELTEHLSGYRVADAHFERAENFRNQWNRKVDEIYGLKSDKLTQGEVIGCVNEISEPGDVVVCAAGSMPGDLHKLWRSRSVKNFHLEYGYSCMGYEIAGGLGVKMADADREVYVMVGDGSYLMMAQEIATSIQEDRKLIIVLVNNHGFASIGGLSRSLGSKGFGTRYLIRDPDSGMIGDDTLDEHQVRDNHLPVDLASNAGTLGAIVLKADDRKQLEDCLRQAKATDRTTVIYVEADRYAGVPGYSWWNVPVAEVSEMTEVKKAYDQYKEHHTKQRHYLKPFTE